MKYYHILLSFYLVTLLSGNALAESTVVDSSSILTEKQFLSMVVGYHPIARQSELLAQQGDAYIQKGRGGFDPKLYFDFIDKDFQGKNYYDLVNTGLKIPTWYGVEFKTGWDYAFGKFVNPENSIPSELDGIGYVGVSVSLAQGLTIDKRRTDLIKAKNYAQLNEFQQNNMINDLLKDAIFTYWTWSIAHKKLQLLNETLTNSEIRYEGIKQTFFLGELSVLDTLEAFTQIQAIKTEIFAAEASYLQSGYELNNYLWTENYVPLEIDGLQPESIDNKIDSPEFNENWSQANTNIQEHPLIKSYGSKLAILEADRRLKKNNLLPKLSVQYNVLTPNHQFDAGNYLSNHYKWGVNFSIPLFLRKERGALRLSQIAVEQQTLKIGLKQQEIRSKILTYQAKTQNLIKQEDTYQNAVNGYTTLLDQEEIKLLSGESSLFKLTSREMKLLRATIKLTEIQLKLVQSATLLIHSSGQLYLKQ